MKRQVTRPAGAQEPPRRETVVLAITLAVAMGASVFAAPSLGLLAPFFLTDLGLTPTVLGLLISATAVCTALLAPPLGGMADRLGAGRALRLLFVLVILSCAILTISHSVWLLALGLLISALPNALGNPVTNRAVVDYVPAPRQGLAIGGKQGGVQIGIAILGATLPATAVAWGWRRAFLVPAAMAAIGLLLTRTLPPQRQAIKSSRASRSGLARFRPLYELSIYSALMGVATGAVLVFTPLYLEQRVDFSPSLAGLAIAVLGVVGLVGRVGIAWVLGGRQAFEVPLAILGSVSVLGLVLLASAQSLSPGLVWLAIPILGVSTSTWNVIAMLAALAAAPSEGAGKATGQVIIGFMAGFAGGPPLFGMLVDLSSGAFTLAWLGIAMCPAAAALLMIRVRPA